MNWRINVCLSTVLMLVSAGLFASGEKTLTIEGYPDEPWQLVELRISGKSVKDRIATKQQFQPEGWRLDTVSFTDTDDWYRRMLLRFRSVTDKPILGVQGSLFFKPATEKMLYGVQLTRSRNLHANPLQPGEEIELTVNEVDLDRTLLLMKEKGVDPRTCEISVSLDMAFYSETLRWYRGKLVHPDPTVPNKWIPVTGRSQ